MQLHTRHTYSLDVAGPMPEYPPLTAHRKADVLVIGTGISGALTGWTLQRAGYDTLLIDRRAAATGSTAASTSLLQYELDTPLHELSRRIGPEKAARAYQLCHQALFRLEQICASAGAGALFERRPSLQYASSRKDLRDLAEECRLRRALGIEVEMISAELLDELFYIARPGALLSAAGAQVDAYRLSHHLLQGIMEAGGSVHAHTEAVDIQRTSEGIRVRTDAGVLIEAKKLVIACGYESQRYLPKTVEELYVTYAIVSEPVDPQLFWHQRSLIWETAHPYLYLRTTPDDRVLIGGKDDRFDGRTHFPRCREKALALHAAFSELMPHIPFRTATSWAGIFAGTPDGLPFIGPVEGQPNTYYALGFGGNGILFSVLAADIICGLIRNGKHEDAALFSFSRA